MSKFKAPVRKKSKPKKKSKTFLKRILFGFLILFSWITISFLAFFVWIVWDVPDIKDLNVLLRNPSVIIKDQKGNTLGTYGDIFSRAVHLNELPEHVSQAIISVEDRRFYQHYGVDIIGIIRAFYANRKAGRIVQGGSSITQQLAKCLLMSSGRFKSNDQSYRRKLQEVYLSILLEMKFNKKQILSLYINRVYLGAGTWGIDAASQQYFGKPANNLTVFESAVIAGLLKAPSKYSPRANPDKTMQRAEVVLKLMEENGYVKNYKQYLEEGKIELEKIKSPERGMRYFTDWIYETIPLHVQNEKMEDIEVITTLDYEMQKVAELGCAKIMDQDAKKYKVKEIALVIISPHGEVRAMVGGRNYNDSQFNRVTQALRQPGSAIKPLIYLAALEHLGLSIYDQIDDSPFKTDKWAPGNYRWKTRGSVSLLDALRFSVNSVTPRLTKMVGVKNVQNTLKSLGIYSEQPNNLTIALGTGEVTLLDITSAFASFSNGGYLVNPHGILMIKNKEGKILYKRKPFTTPRVISPRAYDSLRTMLKAVVVSGTGTRAMIGNTVSGKTGSNGDLDAWFIGYREHVPGDNNQGFTDVAIGVHVGNDDNEKMDKQSVGGRIPATVARKVLLGE